MGIVKKIETNIAKFVPSALKRRYGRAARGVVRAGARLHVLVGGVERSAVLVKDLGELARVKFADGTVEDVPASSIRRSPKRRSTLRLESLPAEPPMVQQPEPMAELPEDALEDVHEERSRNNARPHGSALPVQGGAGRARHDPDRRHGLRDPRESAATGRRT